MSCSSDDDKIDDGSGNTSDVAVSGLPSEIGTTYVCLNGYVNLNLLPAGSSSPSIGIELYIDGELEEDDWEENGRYETSRELNGNKFTVEFDGLAGEKTYKYRTFVTAGNLSYYGEYRTFTTKNFSNITSTGEVSDITFTSAAVAATVDVKSINPKEDIGIGIAYSTDKFMLHPDSVFNRKACYWDEVEEKSYSVTLSRLLTGTDYYYCSYTRAGGSYKLGAIKSFKTKSLDGQLTTGNATDITFASAILSGTSTIASLYPEGKSISYGFRYALTKDALEGTTIPEGYIYYGDGYYYNPQTGDYISVSTNGSKTVSASIENNIFTARLTGLNANKTYYYYAYAKVDGTELTGEIKNFTTKSMDGYLTVEEAEDVTFTSATIKGKTTLESLFEDEYNHTTITYRLLYATNKSYLESDNSYYYDYVTPTLSDEDLTVSLSSLSEEVTYYYRLRAYVDGTYLYSDIKDFKTKSASDYLSTGEATNITMTTAEVAGTTKLPEIYPSTSSITYYVYYATSESYLTSSYSSYRKSVTASKDESNLKASLSELSSNQTYYYRVVAYVDGKYVYGETKSFTTKSGKDYLSMDEATNITMTTAEVTGSTTLSSVYPSSSSIEYYVYYATSENNLAYSNNSVSVSKDGDNLNATLSNLTVATTYYYCVVASVNGTKIYGDAKSFTTKDLQTTGYVDLGLSCKWAACNLGASTPESTGEFYGWGDVESRTFFYSSNNANYQKDIGEDISATDYDAARKILGSPWRMPTKTEFQELLDKCKFQEITYKNTKGYLVTGKNGNAIFLPKAGYKKDSSNYSGYYYWTSTKYDYSSYPNRYAYIFEDSYITDVYRYYGCTIRPVQD